MGMVTVPTGQLLLVGDVVFFDSWVVAHARGTRNDSSELIPGFFNLRNGLRYVMGVRTVILKQMTFTIEATKDNHHINNIRASVIDAVILARKFVADGFTVSITTPAGVQYSADKFNLLLTGKSSDSPAETGGE
jgi:hypothetical protein